VPLVHGKRQSIGLLWAFGIAGNYACSFLAWQGVGYSLVLMLSTVEGMMLTSCVSMESHYS
jgi:hypothetical protein